jgi:hypothetical protein
VAEFFGHGVDWHAVRMYGAEARLAYPLCAAFFSCVSRVSWLIVLRFIPDGAVTKHSWRLRRRASDVGTCVLLALSAPLRVLSPELRARQRAWIVGEEMLRCTHRAETRLAASVSVCRSRLDAETRRLPEDSRWCRIPIFSTLIIQLIFTFVNRCTR